MDRPITQSVKDGERKKRIIKYGTIGSLALFLFVMLYAWISPSVDRVRLRTAKVYRGDIEAVITSSGVVVPEFEQILSSPIETRVLKVLHRAGDSLHVGDTILTLDASSSKLAYDKLRDQLLLKENAQAQLSLSLQGKLAKLTSQLRVKKLDVESAKSKYNQNLELIGANAISKNELEQSMILYEKAKAELQDLEEDQKSSERSAKLQAEGIALEISILRKDLDDAARQLALATPRAQQSTVLTWVNQSEGATVHKGDMVAKLADLKSYRVDATVSDVHASQLSVGMPVRIRTNDTLISGIISSIPPTIENGIMKLTIALDLRSHASLRSNLRVDVFIVPEKHVATLCVKKPTTVAGSEGKTSLFVIRNSIALRTPVRIGISGMDEVEIVSGLSEGDEVIISDMKEYENLKEVKIK